MSVIDEVKSRIDIVDLVGQHITLQRAGRNFRALCPFHPEKTPSFHVSPERQTWHCFGACGTGGDIFSFIMRREGVDFGEALRQLAERAGVNLIEQRSPQEDERRLRLLEANEAAASFYHNLLVNSNAAKSARAYLESRGLDAPTIEAFQIGYSPDGWDALREHLVGRGFVLAQLLEAGLVVESERGGYDRFRNRLMFPISDERGRIVGFGGRQLEGAADGAKYLNTQQTALFDKSGLLYGLDRARESVRAERAVIVVEGYMDVIAAHQHGITNAVASMGTALTERQIRTLDRLKSKIYLALDADAAGIEATLRALQEAEATGAVRAASISAHPDALGDDEFAAQAQEWSRDALKRAAVNFFVVPLSGKDPDEMIRADRVSWDEAVANAKPFTDHVFDVVAERKDLTQPGERSALLQELLPVVRLIEEPVYRAHYVQRLARLALVDEDTVRLALGRGQRGTRRRPAAVLEPAPTAPARPEPGEEFCLALLLHYPELRPEGKALPMSVFSSGAYIAMYEAWRDTSDLEELRGALTQELLPQLEQIVSRSVPFLEGTQLREALQDCVRRIELRRLSEAKRMSTAAIASAEGHEQFGSAIEEAWALLDQSDTSDAKGSELAATLVEDMKAGQRLHHRPRPTQEHGETAPSEVSP
ncbi:MAG: DNA primase [Dehalococcoidia bacterium]